MGLPALTQPEIVTAEEYLAFEIPSGEKHEFFDGHIIAMAGAGWNHSRVQKNLIHLLEAKFREKSRPCEAFGSDTRTQLSQSRYFYPDVSVYCKPPEVDEKNNFTNPTVVIEIVSKSTEHFDRGEKAAAYRKMPSLQQIVIIDPETLSVEVYDRQAEIWLFREAQGKTGTIAVADIECPLAEIFFNVERGQAS